MKIAAIVAEYNPFHNGHEYMIKKIKEELSADYILVVMSGDFTQRGLPGIADKYTRAHMALSCGADAVFELPVRFATASAEQFAYGAVSLFDAFSCVDTLVFGSESGDIPDFYEAADLLDQAPESFGDAIRAFQKEGHSYPKAFSLAMASGGQTAKLSSALLANPNNLLGLEYVRALKKLDSSIEPYTITRTGTGYHDTHTAFSEESDSMIASASAIRNMLASTIGTIATAQPSMPEAAYRLFADAYGLRVPVTLDDFSLLLTYQLSRETKESLCEYADISPDLADRILKGRDEHLTFTDRIASVKHKQHTYARINRALLHVLLNLKVQPKPSAVTPENTTPGAACTTDIAPAPYARLLGMKKTASPLMKTLKAHTTIPIITKPADAKKILDEKAMVLFEEDISAANLYEHIVAEKFHTTYSDDMRHGIILI